MSKELHIALKKAIDDFGTDILKSSKLVSILSDYHAFDIHDPLLTEKKSAILYLAENKYVDKLIDLQKKSDSPWLTEEVLWLEQLCRKYGLQRNTVILVADTIKKSLGLDNGEKLTVDNLSGNSIAKIDRSVMMNKTYVGIDFGTSSTVVSYALLDQNNHLQCETLTLTTKHPDGVVESCDIIPTLVACENGRPIFGPAAEKYKHTKKQGVNIWRSFKMELGEDQGNVYSNSELGPNSKYPILNPKDAARLFFRYLQSRIKDAISKKGLPNDIEYVVSIPASFEANQRQDLLDVLNENGIESDHLSLIDEPNAAFLSYICESIKEKDEIYLPSDKTVNVLVFDYGAGTCDISILGITKERDGVKSENIAISKFAKCGGDDIDHFIAEKYLYPQIREKNDFRGISLRSNEESEIYRRLMAPAELLKIQICENVSLQMTDGKLPIICNSDEIIMHHAGEEIDVRKVGKVELSSPELSYRQFNEAMKVFLNQETRYLTKKNDNYTSVFTNVFSALKKANLSKKDIHYVLLIGGSSKNPYLQYALRHYFEYSTLLIPRNLQTHVSRGAAIHSFIYHTTGRSLINPILSEDILVIIKGEKEKVIIPAGSPIPTPKIAIDDLRIDTDGQKTIEIPFCTGSKDKMLMNMVIDCPDQQYGYHKGDKVRLEIIISPDKLLQGNAWVNTRRYNIKAINPFANKELSTTERKILELTKEINNERTKNGKPSRKSLNALKEVYHHNNMKLEEAELLEEIHDIYPADASYNNISVAYHNAGRYNTALEFIKLAYEESPNSPSIAFNYALDVKNTDEDKYQELLKRCIELDSQDPVHLFEYGRWLTSKGNSSEGKPLIDKAIRIWKDRFDNGHMCEWDYSWFASAADFIGEHSLARDIRVKESELFSKENYYNTNNLINTKQ